jgi:hypothetical protein
MNGMRDRIAYPVLALPKQRGKSARRIRGCHSHPFNGKGKPKVKKLGRARWVPAAISLIVAGAAVAAPATASASARLLPVAGHVYLDDNNAGTNTMVHRWI